MIAERYNFPSATDDTFSTFPPEEYKKQWPQYVLKLQDVLLGPYGTIYDEKRKLIAGANYNYSFWNDGVPSPASPLDAQQEKYLKAPSLPQKVVDLPGDINYIYAHHYFNIYVYGHLHDTLQDLSKIEQLGLSGCKLITSPFTAHVNNLDKHFALFGYDINSCHQLDLNPKVACMYKVPTLYYPSPTAYPSNISRQGYSFLKSKYAPLKIPYSNKSDKLYLTRPGAHRKVKNETEVVAFLKDRGFFILKGDEPLEQHITLFRNAKTIIGAHGALFKNLIFCEDNPVILEFNPSSLNNPCYAEGLALSAGLTNYNYILSESDEQHNSTIDIDKLKRILD
jgi:capsular polysaccharide biosynthesis protein